ncbi:MAG: hypothetical protein QM535_08200 [Limnohabitans sp.]|nr:hypothetical protein [Limnohabitans sp.]
MRVNSTTPVLIFIYSIGIGYSLFNQFVLETPKFDLLSFSVLGFFLLFLSKQYQQKTN